MDFSIIFQNSGDAIPFRTINDSLDEVLSYYVEKLNEQNLNTFSSPVAGKIKHAIETLHTTIVECNKFVYELLDYNIDTYSTEEYLEQRNLNKLHADWVKSQHIKYNILEKKNKYASEQANRIHNIFPDDVPEPYIGSVVSRLGYADTYNQLNIGVHNLEQLFANIKFFVGEWVEFPNPFPKSYITNDVCNFRFNFNHLGRSLENKFNSFDHTMEFDDENSFNELLGFVELNLMSPQTIPLSSEYVEWCKKFNKEPSGKYFNIGNIPYLNENLTKYREIIFRNSLQNNVFSIQLNKGK
jgi:hypothetical protein